MSIFEKEGGANPCVHVHKQMYNAPPGNFRCKIASGAFSGTL